jgi:mono/diheme cytochrome c family protein
LAKRIVAYRCVAYSLAACRFVVHSGKRKGLAPKALRTAVLSLAAALFVAGCSGEDTVPLSEAAQRGRGIYLNVCVACHSANPAQDGTLGPNLAGTTRELLEWRVVKGSYPPGYTPKRTTGGMPAFPHLAGQLDDLHAFIRESTEGTAAR